MAGRKKTVVDAAPAAAPATEAVIKSDYQLAVEAGYNGTEDQFNDPESVVDNPIQENPIDEPQKPEVIEPLFKPGVEKQVGNAGEAIIEVHNKLVVDHGFKGTVNDLENFIKGFNSEKATGKYIVTKPFKDAARYLQPGQSAKTYAVGEDVSHLELLRLSELEAKNLVTKVSE